MDYQNLTDLEKDQVKEVINVGNGNSSTAFSKITDSKVIMGVPELFIDRIDKVTPFLQNLNQLVTVVLLKVGGEVSGFMLLEFPPDSALSIAGLLTKNHKKDIKILDEMDRSALKELGNIFTGSSMTALSKFLGVNLIQSVPDVATDTFGALMNSIIIEIGQTSDIVLIFRTAFTVENLQIKGNYYFIFTPQSTKKIIEVVKLKYS